MRVNFLCLYRQNYIVKIVATYRDGDNQWYRTTASLAYIPSQHRLEFGASTFEYCGPVRPVSSVVPPVQATVEEPERQLKYMEWQGAGDTSLPTKWPSKAEAPIKQVVPATELSTPQKPSGKSVQPKPNYAPVPQLANGRTFVPDDVDYQFLIMLYHKYTSVQASKLAEVYIGKWLTISVTVGDVAEKPEGMLVVASLGGPGTNLLPAIISFQFRHQWKGHLSMLAPGSRINVVGRIYAFNSTELRLTECELL